MLDTDTDTDTDTLEKKTKKNEKTKKKRFLAAALGNIRFPLTFPLARPHVHPHTSYRVFPVWFTHQTPIVQYSVLSCL